MSSVCRTENKFGMVAHRSSPIRSRLSLTLRLAFGLALPVFFVSAQRKRRRRSGGENWALDLDSLDLEEEELLLVCLEDLAKRGRCGRIL